MDERSIPTPSSPIIPRRMAAFDSPASHERSFTPFAPCWTEDRGLNGGRDENRIRTKDA
jgi:hypothetical protein